MMKSSPKNVTLLLMDWRDGDREALDRLIPVVYVELKRLASGYLRRERIDHTLQPTALVNEAYIRLIDQRWMNWQNRAHFFGAASELMRRILVDHARAHGAKKRGGGAYKVSLREISEAPEQEDLDLVSLDDALTELAALDAQLSRLVELRFFGGLSIEETAEVMGTSPSTIKRHWKTAQAWLYRRLKEA